MNIDWTTVPGYTDALVAQRSRRDASFILDETVLCGESVRHITPWHMLVLEAAGNPFVTGGVIRPEHVPQFIWVVSVNYSPDATRDRDKMISRCRKLIYSAAISEIQSYISDANRDAPGSSGVGSTEPCSWVSTIVHRLATQYGWSERNILNLPLVRIWQYVRCIRMDGGDTCFINDVDRVKSRYLREISNGN